jgi:hypothetical protein
MALANNDRDEGCRSKPGERDQWGGKVTLERGTLEMMMAAANNNGE